MCSQPGVSGWEKGEMRLAGAGRRLHTRSEDKQKGWVLFQVERCSCRVRGPGASH